jgi:2-dehydro-3-deoxyphosphooctonate aldolase (KDO 8-P synthase)
MNNHTVRLNENIVFANDRPFILIGGMNVLESRDLAMEVAEQFATVTRTLGIPYVFKASFDKANRSSIHSFRGPGLDKGLALLAEVKARFGVPILTDVHEPYQAAPAAQVADILQLPAFLARQTDLVTALAGTGAIVNVKKPQFLAPEEMRHILSKFAEHGHRDILLSERGTSFGYNNLVVDMLGMDIMKAYAPVVFDVTHSLQRPGGRADSADGRGAQAAALPGPVWRWASPACSWRRTRTRTRRCATDRARSGSTGFSISWRRWLRWTAPSNNRPPRTGDDEGKRPPTPRGQTWPASDTA